LASSPIHGGHQGKKATQGRQVAVMSDIFEKILLRGLGYKLGRTLSIEIFEPSNTFCIFPSTDYWTEVNPQIGLKQTFTEFVLYDEAELLPRFIQSFYHS